VRAFDYHEPASVDEALGLLGTHGEDATVMAGGTALVLLMRQGLVRPAHVVGLRRLSTLAGVARHGSLRLGALLTIAAAARSADVQTHCPALAEAFRSVATVRIRNQATVGGNLAHADPASDPPAMLLALDAVALARGPLGERRIPLAEFFRDVFTTALSAEELLVAVEVPPLPSGARAAYLKFLPRTADDYATVSVAACVATSADGRVAHARVALGGAGSTPLRARLVESALLGERGAGHLSQIAALAREEVDPFDDLRGTADYKREMARVWTERVLRGLLA
jgi:carbon-monoxide dehydrogenase medium subunit